jgi:hypothetical protein
MLKITFLGNFRVDYSSESHHAKTLESMGHTVIKLQETVADSSQILNSAKDSDLFVWVHTHKWVTPGNMTMKTVLNNLNSLGIPTMTYHLDLWMGLQREKDLKNDSFYKSIGHFFTVDKLMADWFNDNTKVVGHYLPAGVYGEEATYKPRGFRRDIAFVGSKNYHPEWPYRKELINHLQKKYGNSFQHWGGDGKGIVRGTSLNRLYATTKIVIGDTLCPDFSYPNYWSDRVYETMGRGGFIIHPRIEGLEDEFTDKEHIVFYDYQDFDQLDYLIRYYLKNDEERESIRNKGHQLVKEKYTYKNRWETILKELNL